MGRSTEQRMQRILDRLSMPLNEVWQPDLTADRQGEIRGRCFLIYSAYEEEGWLTLQHEIYEHKFKEVTHKAPLAAMSAVH